MTAVGLQGSGFIGFRNLGMRVLELRAWLKFRI